MHACAALLEELLALMDQEEKALAADDLDKVEELAKRRAALLEKVWQTREGYGEDELRRGLLRVSEKQDELQRLAEDTRQRLRQQQDAGRKQTRYFNGDRYVNSQAQRAFYCDKLS